ncbi:MAG: hypothetical protein KKA36_02385 [Gammaproteobacteria bacterium]|nr:hypothetical protein [Gammaproteobacteria bacterium]MBU2477911.1 hypothetical protein [Gammaproteobacteria bacterium]
MSTFNSLTLALEGLFASQLDDLPVPLRQRVEQDLFPLPWNELSANQRRVAAFQWDYQNDPDTEQDRERWFDFEEQKLELKRQIGKWEAAASPTTSDLAMKETKLKELRESLARMEHDQNRSLQNYFPKVNPITIKDGAKYIAYPKAMALLARLGATVEEMAMWVFMGAEDGGLSAFLNVNELDTPRRFHYGIGHRNDDFDYLSPLMACWFKEDEILDFEPTERYITGQALVERWRDKPHIQPEAFIQAKIAESRLVDVHPIYGLTQGSNPDDTSYPPLAMALFDLSHVEAIEHEDFDHDLPTRPEKPHGYLNYDPALQAKANQIAADHRAATGRSITRGKVAQRLAKQFPLLDAASIERRIRKQWK